MKYKTETKFHSVKIKIEIEKVLEDFYSEFNHIEIVKTRSLGKILFLDNEIQFAELDEFIYHEMFCFPALLSHPDPRRILIIGGGDMLLAKQVLRSPNVEIVDLIELDRYVIKFCVKHFKQLIHKTKSHPKLNIRIEDGYEFIKNCNTPYDIVYIDLPDKKKNCEFAYKDNFYEEIKKILNPQGILSAQTGNASCFYYSQRSKKIRKMLSTTNIKSYIEYLKIISHHFNNTLQYRQHIPSFFDEWSFTIGSNEIDFKNIKFDQIENNYERLNLKPLYYSPSYHKSIMFQPKLVEELASCVNRFG
ncbi:MAG: hypothetical protein ACFE8G_08235 [Candidatus Hermodarchaeota archaeon]